MSVLPALTPISLIGQQTSCETIALPTGTHVFRRGSPADAIYGVHRGIVELIDASGEKTCYRAGEFFSFNDIVLREGVHAAHALARTPVEIFRLERPHFLNLLHHQPTLAIQLIGQEHLRLREQRSSGTCCY